MADLIDRAALDKDIEETVRFSVREGVASAERRGADKVIYRIQAAPAVDAVEVVRCKDCRFCKKHPTSDDVKMCTNQEWSTEYYPLVEDDDYCSYGERREDDG